MSLKFLFLPAILFVVGYFPALTELSRGLVSPHVKADVRRRFIAAVIDGLLCVTCVYFGAALQSPAFLVVGATYLVLRDAVGGQSVGKFLQGLIVVSLETGRPCGFSGSARRNLLFLVPGANVVAVFLEAFTLVREPQGQRLGDRLAQTQVVEGLGAKELIKSFQRAWLAFLGALGPGVRRPDRRPVEVDR